MLLALLVIGTERAHAQNRNQLVHTGSTSPGVVTVTQAAGVYTLRFVGDETISYQVDTTDPSVAKGTIRVY